MKVNDNDIKVETKGLSGAIEFKTDDPVLIPEYEFEKKRIANLAKAIYFYMNSETAVNAHVLLPFRHLLPWASELKRRINNLIDIFKEEIDNDET